MNETQKSKRFLALLVVAVLVLGGGWCITNADLQNAREEIETLESDMEEVTAERNELDRACAYFDDYVEFLQGELDNYGYWEELADVEATVSSSGEKSFIVYITEADDMYHKDGCQSLSESKYEMDIKDASYYGCTACPLCYSGEDVPDEYTESSNENQSITVYVTNTGEKYHKDGCQYLSQSKNPISLEDAVNYGYTPCSRCY